MCACLTLPCRTLMGDLWWSINQTPGLALSRYSEISRSFKVKNSTLQYWVLMMKISISKLCIYLWVITIGFLLWRGFCAFAGLLFICIEEIIILISPGYMRYARDWQLAYLNRTKWESIFSWERSGAFGCPLRANFLVKYAYLIKQIKSELIRTAVNS